MSLVAYDSSDDSDRDDRDERPASAPRPPGKIAGLFASLPAPRISAPQHKRMTMDLPKAKKRTEPVKITVPVIKPADSDSDEDEPVRKKSAPQGGGGLSSLLPQPKNLVMKETARPLLPHTLTKRPGSDKPKVTPAKSQALSGSSPSPSAIKAAAKSAALQLAKQMAADEEGSDDELAPENYFSLPESSAQHVMSQNPHSQQYVPSLHPLPGVEDTPLDFVPNADSRSVGAMQDYESGEYQPQYPANPLPETSPQDYYGEGYFPDPNPAADDQEDSGSSSLFNDEAFRRLQGKQNRGREEIKFLEIKGDDQLSGNKQWLTKNMTAEAEPRKSFSKKKGDQPTGQQRRKHQITYLIHQAKERELELKNNWADNKLTRRQTQAKYGF
ncbi:proline-rich protein PRCC-like [Carassius gibelio]|uniref:proline-rich protein PRCC-like n=1 Tax=Carassius gibelio TaxID=101364 RepID=UPI002278E627|nr:proline-rich protein PRCC-like [Carassius gibelio]XP_052441216.1 proline-rich protein PRCC-like [Carassius gibelio]XP_052441217.1 proline-rich protein PRCC-like [Carassius gibelio]